MPETLVESRAPIKNLSVNHGKQFFSATAKSIIRLVEVSANRRFRFLQNSIKTSITASTTKLQVAPALSPRIPHYRNILRSNGKCLQPVFGHQQDSQRFALTQLLLFHDYKFSAVALELQTRLAFTVLSTNYRGDKFSIEP